MMAEDGQDIVTTAGVLWQTILDRIDFTPRIDRGTFPWKREDAETFRMVSERDDDSLRLLVAARELQGTNEYGAAIDSISSDSGFGPHLGKLVGDPFALAGFYAQHVLDGLILEAASNPEDVTAALRGHVDRLREQVSRTSLQGRFLGPLPSGFDPTTSSPVVLDDRTSLHALSDADIATVLLVGLSFGDGRDAFGFAHVGTPWGIEVRFELPVVILDAGEEVPDDTKATAKEALDEARSQLERVIRAFRITKAGRISVIGVLNTGAIGMTFSSSRLPRPPFDRYSLEDADLKTLRTVLRLLADPAVVSSPALGTAVSRFSSSIERHDEEDRLLDLIIGAEALFAGDSEAGDLSLRVAQRFARFLQERNGGGSSVMELFKHMKDQYGGA